MKGLIVAFLLAFLIYIVLLLVDHILNKYFKVTKEECALVMYSNSGNLIVPIVVYIPGCVISMPLLILIFNMG